MNITSIDLPLLLPDLADNKDRCVTRLLTLLQDRSGIHKVHVKPESPAVLCIHYSQDTISLEQVKRLAKQSGFELTQRYAHSLLVVTGIRHPRHARSIERSLRTLEGLVEIALSASGVIRLEWDREKTNQAQVFSALRAQGLQFATRQAAPVESGTEAEEHGHGDAEEHGHGDAEDHGQDDGHDHAGGDSGDHAHAHGGWFGEYTELYFAIASGVCWVGGLVVFFVGGAPAWLPTSLYIAAFVLGGYFTLLESVETVRKGQFEIDFLMLVAAAGAAALGKWEEGALLLFLFSLGHALEAYAMGKARKSIAALAELAPATALLKKDGDVLEVGIEALQIGDVIVVRPNSKIAADGVIVAGSSAVDQAPITGESVPVDKMPVDDPQAEFVLDRLAAENRAFAGTINGSTVLEVKVLRLAADSTLSRLVELVKEAETQKSPTQQLTDRFERYFVPSVLALVGLLLFAFLVIDESFSASFYRAMAVLVAASPCALAISTPSAVLAGVARAAKQGVLIKGGRPLEDLGSLSAIAFDKTGTLTEGRPTLTEVIPSSGVTEKELLTVAVAVEALSDHPLAGAIVSGGKERLGVDSVAPASDVEALMARGIKAQLDGTTVHIGNARLFEELTGEDVPEEMSTQMQELAAKGQTAMIVHRDDRYLGLIAVMDVAREEAARTLRELSELGIKRMIMLTGDHQQVADAVAKTLGITDPMGSLLPEDKVRAIDALRAEEGRVAMVGDGVNDAPAMAKSTVGIAMGAAGSDVALETADIALMADRLDNLPFAIGLSRKAKSIIQQNLWLSLGMVAVLIPSTIMGWANIGIAVAMHEGSTLVVVGNALRLLAYKKR